MKVIIQLQYSFTASRVFYDVKNITQSSLHPTQPNPTHGWTQPMTNSDIMSQIWYTGEPLCIGCFWGTLPIASPHLSTFTRWRHHMLLKCALIQVFCRLYLLIKVS